MCARDTRSIYLTRTKHRVGTTPVNVWLTCGRRRLVVSDTDRRELAVVVAIRFLDHQTLPSRRHDAQWWWARDAGCKLPSSNALTHSAFNYYFLQKQRFLVGAMQQGGGCPKVRVSGQRPSLDHPAGSSDRVASPQLDGETYLLLRVQVLQCRAHVIL